MSDVIIIRTDGTIEDYKPSVRGIALLHWIKKQIGAECTDTFNLKDGRIVIVDDDGWEVEMLQHDNNHFEAKPIRNKKPINAKATELYHSICRPGATHQIAGDVAIAWDRDFA